MQKLVVAGLAGIVFGFKLNSDEADVNITVNVTVGDEGVEVTVDDGCGNEADEGSESEAVQNLVEGKQKLSNVLKDEEYMIVEVP